MVTVNFKLSTLGCIKSELNTPARFEVLLEQYALKVGQDLGSVIAVRDGRVLSLQDVVEKGDVIDVFPALSGG